MIEPAAKPQTLGFSQCVCRFSVVSGTGALRTSLNRAIVLEIQSSSVESAKPVLRAHFSNAS